MAEYKDNKGRVNKGLFTQLVRAQGIELQLSESVMEDITYRVVKGVRYIKVGLSLQQVLFADNPQKQIIEVVLHEIGHLWVAPKSRRNKRDYGCPPNAEESPRWELEEAKAMLVEHRLSELLGLKPSKDPFDNRTVNGAEQAKAWFWWNQGGRLRTDTLWLRAMDYPTNMTVPMSLDTP